MTKILFSATLLFILSFGKQTFAQGVKGSIDTEANELVCQMNDFLETKIFVDTDYLLDNKIGEFSTKIIEMPTKNAYGNNYHLFQVNLVEVTRSRCLHCRDSQIILYKAEGEDTIINKLEITSSTAKITRNVDAKGNPLYPSFVDEGTCVLNEVQ